MFGCTTKGEGQRLRWLPIREDVLSTGVTAVNEDDTIAKLVEMHRHAFNLVNNGGSGLAFDMALVDNISGAEKIAFAKNYISKSVSHLSYYSYSPEFRNSLSTARTVIVTLERGALASLSYDGIQNVIVRQFLLAVNLMIDNGELEGTADCVTDDRLRDAIYRFISETQNPLFLVLDGVGGAFEDDSTTLLQQRERFLQFCKSFLEGCLMTRNFYLLLMGNSAFQNLDTLEYTGKAVDIDRICLKKILRSGYGWTLIEQFGEMPLNR